MDEIPDHKVFTPFHDGHILIGLVRYNQKVNRSMCSPVHILAVEDDDVDAECLQRYFQKKDRYQLTVVTDGLTALQTLREQARQSSRFCPLILLDLNLPIMDGLSFLEAIRQDPALQRHIVFILTTSNLPTDKSAAYAAGVAGYVLKSNISDFLPLLDTYCSLIEFPQNVYLL